MKRACLSLAAVATMFMQTARGADVEPLPFPAKMRPQAAEAQKLFAGGKWSEAARIYEAMKEAAPDNAWILSNLAMAQLRMGQTKQGEETLRAAVKVAPDDGFCRRMLGTVLYSRQKYDDAITQLNKAVEIDPADAEAHLYLAFCAAQKGQAKSAESEFALAAKLNPDFKTEATKATDADRRWPIGDYLTPLEKSRLQLPAVPGEP